MALKKPNTEKNQPAPSLLNKVIPQAKINLVQPPRSQNRQGGANQSKSLEPKHTVLSSEKLSNEKIKKNNPLKTIYDKINLKKEIFGIIFNLKLSSRPNRKTYFRSEARSSFKNK